MSTLRNLGARAARRVLGEDEGTRLLSRLSDVGSVASYSLSRRGRQSRRRLDDMRDLHMGQRCFILGNGPSLAQMDLTPLRGEVTFGLNRAYLLFDRIGFSTTYMVAVNKLVIEQCAADLEGLPMPLFAAWHSRKFLDPGAAAILVRTVARPGFATNVANGVWEGATVTYVALQLAFHMGFETVILLGVDHSFATTGPAHKEVVSPGDDPNHFDPTYFGKGFRWNLPDLKTSEIAYTMALRAYERSGRQILDATVGGKLRVFPKADYRSLVEGSESQASRG